MRRNLGGMGLDKTVEHEGVALGDFLSPASFWTPDRLSPSPWLAHGPFAFWIVEALRPRRVVELGTRDGWSFLAFCQAVRRLGYPARLFAVDGRANDAAPSASVKPQAGHVPGFSDIARFVRSPIGEAAAQFEDGSVDLLHLDGDDDQGARADLDVWAPKLSGSAVVLIHGVDDREPGSQRWRLWADIEGRHPSFAFFHGRGLGVVGMGGALPPRMGAFFAAAARHPGVLRETYARLGSAVEDRLAAGARSGPAPERPAPAVPAAAVAPRAADEPIHIHLAAMAPRFLDVRTHLPLAALSGRPGVATSLSERQIDLPRLPVEAPKVVVLQRAGLGGLERWRSVTKDIVGRGWLVVSELDDHPDLLGAVHNKPVDATSWRIVVFAHAVQTSTPSLAEAIRVYNPHVTVFPNCAFTLARAPRRPSPDGRTRVFFGALNRERFSRQVGDALAPFAAAHREVEFVVIHDRAFFESLGDCSKTFHPAQPYDAYLRLMSGCDIALMPLEGGPGERFKSDVKWVEASALGLASVASPLVYGDSIRDGATGLLATTVAEWPAKLAALVGDPAMRAAVAAAAHAEVVGGRTFAAQADARLAWYRSLWRDRFALTDDMKKRYAAAV